MVAILTHLRKAVDRRVLSIAVRVAVPPVTVAVSADQEALHRAVLVVAAATRAVQEVAEAVDEVVKNQTDNPI